jgi:quinol monooxygenase YgiN
MIVVLFKVRATSPQAAQELCRFHRQSFEWYQSPGSLGAWCLVSTSDPQQMVVVEQWGSRAAYDAWRKSPANVEYQKKAGHLWVGNIQHEVYEEV